MKKKINWKPYITSGIISLVVGLILFVVFRFVLQMSLVDSFAFPGVILVSLSLLLWIAKEGFFDIFSYGFRQMGSMLFSKNPREYNDYPGYKDFKNQIREKRAKIYYSFAIVGIIFLVATLIVYIITKSMI